MMIIVRTNVSNSGSGMYNISGINLVGFIHEDIALNKDYIKDNHILIIVYCKTLLLSNI